ncbi:MULTISPECIES: hypothetical protein [unclassified Novosphingobium]|uniref:hypothetical protein n=1 Tax=unclassified Novosphingobium TaxID=2644732 RepID=UPI00135C93F7|nr:MULTISPECIES: hypothetical protein [unclassified Novosphingobium]
MKRTHTCKTCMHFRPGADSDMSEPAPIESTDDLGVCEYREPVPRPRPIGPLVIVGTQPVVHASRSCQEYLPDDLDEGGGDDGDGLPVPGNVRHLASVTPRAA